MSASTTVRATTSEMSFSTSPAVPVTWEIPCLREVGPRDLSPYYYSEQHISPGTQFLKLYWFVLSVQINFLYTYCHHRVKSLQNVMGSIQHRHMSSNCRQTTAQTVWFEKSYGRWCLNLCDSGLKYFLDSWKWDTGIVTRSWIDVCPSGFLVPEEKYFETSKVKFSCWNIYMSGNAYIHNLRDRRAGTYAVCLNDKLPWHPHANR